MNPYVPGVWARRYEALPAAGKDAVIRAVNQIFAERTGVRRKLDPNRDMPLVRQWLRIRDEVMSEAAGTGELKPAGVGGYLTIYLGESREPLGPDVSDASRFGRIPISRVNRGRSNRPEPVTGKMDDGAVVLQDFYFEVQNGRGTRRAMAILPALLEATTMPGPVSAEFKRVSRGLVVSETTLRPARITSVTSGRVRLR